MKLGFGKKKVSILILMEVTLEATTGAYNIGDNSTFQSLF